MGFEYVEYDSLAKNIRESIATEIKSFGFDPNNTKKGLRHLDKVYPERAIQCRYLLVVLDSLDKSDHEDKTIILNADAFYVRAQIFASYQGIVTQKFLAPENSTLFNALTTSLNLTNENFPNNRDLLDMYKTIWSFMQANVYRDSDPDKGYLEGDQQLFSGKIPGYTVEDDLQYLVKK
ncbi:MAG: hypothetical protein ACRCXC_04455 [Legionella sp.]